MILLRSLRFSLYFTKALQSYPLSKANAVLSTFLKERVDRVKYEETFSAYQSYLQRIIAENPSVDHHKLSLLDHTTRIYSTYRIPSKKLNRIHNQIADQCLELTALEGPQSVISLLGLIHRYNQKKAIAVFRANKEAITKQMRTFTVPTIMALVRFLKDARIDDTMIRETIIEMLYGEIDFLSELQLAVLSSYLSLSRKYINKDFLLKLAKRITQLYKSGNLQERFLFPILSNITEIEVNLHTRSIYVEELDTLYEVAFPSLFSIIHTLDDRSLNQLVSSLRRSKFYSEPMLSQLVEVGMKREIYELAEEQPAMNKGLSLATFVNVVNTLAVFNYQAPPFKRYLLSILNLLSLHKDDLLSSHHFSRLMWSLCVLFERTELKEAYPLIQRSLARAETVPQHEAMNFYLCYLYLRTAYPQINDHRDKIHRWLESASLETHSSQAQRDAFQLMQDIGVPCLSEYNLNNLICDIMVPEWQNLRNVVIEFHGFRHFCRNVKKLTGSNILKQKIVTGERYGYYFIAIDEWLITADKKEFLRNFMSHLNATFGGKGNETALAVPKTATKVRGRVRTFRVSN